MNRATDRSTISLIGVPMDLGGNRRGVDMGPSAFRIAGNSEKSGTKGAAETDTNNGFEKGVRALGYDFLDRGNVPVGDPSNRPSENGNAHFLTAIADACKNLRDEVRATLADGQFPLVIGGDHAIAVGTVAGVANHYRSEGKPIGVIWFDAHSDMNTPDTSESGNVHGMPLAAITGRGPDALTKLGDTFPIVDASKVAMVGIRSVDAEEAKIVKDSGVLCFTMREIDEQGIRSVMQKAIKHVTDGTAGFHLSFDVDGTDPTVCPGVGTPVEGGVSYREAHTVMEIAAASKKLLSLEMVEINPVLDERNRTALAAKEFALSALGKTIL
ncbi:MAG: arginase [Planctomycetota bacterium]